MVWWLVALCCWLHDFIFLINFKCFFIFPKKKKIFFSSLLITITAGAHVGTDFKPLRWTVPGTLADGKPQSLYQICSCKYTKSPPYCDATHTNLPLNVLKAQRECSQQQANHVKLDSNGNENKICSSCGWVPEWWIKIYFKK